MDKKLLVDVRPFEIFIYNGTAWVKTAALS